MIRIWNFCVSRVKENVGVKLFIIKNEENDDVLFVGTL